MEIPYTIAARPDTGLYNAKLGIWLFLASEVMLFGGLFSAYVLLRVGAEPGLWPHGWLNVTLGTVNTLLLALSAITTLLAWAACKVREFGKFKFFHGCTILLALTFLGIKSYEYRDKLIHYEIAIGSGKYAGKFADGHLVEKSRTSISPKKPARSRCTAVMWTTGRIDGFARDSGGAIRQAGRNHHRRRRHQAHGKLRPAPQHLHRDLFHADRPARAAHFGRHGRDFFLWGPGSKCIRPILNASPTASKSPACSGISWTWSGFSCSLCFI
jgi:hypothetical protein